MMATDNIYAGSFQINGASISPEVLSWTQPSYLHTGAANRKLSIDLHVFNPWLLATLNERSMGEGVRFGITGPDCASILQGPLGHPGDGEYDRWSVERVELSFRYLYRQLHVCLAGRSGRGSGGFSGADGDQEPLGFKVDLVVPTENLKGYLHLPDSAWDFFREKLFKSQEPKHA
jgi:hypothetical protein